jgi:chemotaxis family two-component system sensor kinase Cph1
LTSKDKRSADAAHSTCPDKLLRERAEEIVQEKALLSPENTGDLSPQKTRQMLHELRVHQIELEMQNEELRRTQVELDSARARYFDLYDLAPVGYCTISKNGQIQEANLTAANLLGVTRSALVRQPLTAFILKEDRDLYYRHSKPLFETGAPQVYELRMVKKDAAPFWARLEATREQDADGTLLCRVTVSDITERKRAEEKIAFSEALLNAALDSIPDIIGIQNPDHTIVRYNHAGYKFLNIAPEKVHGRRCYELIGRNIPCDECATEKALNTKKLEHIEKHLPEYGVYLDCRSNPVLNDKGEVEFIVEQLQDITERKHAEQALVKKSEDLARSNADLAQFAYVASHDLQEPLRTITRFVQLLEKRYQGKLDQDADEFIGFIVSGTKRMQQIINDLLAYSRVDTRREPPNIMKIEDAIQRAMQNINYVLEESGGTVIYDEMPSIIADETQMTQLFQNIIGNALKFHGEEAPRVEISAARKEDDWIFSVRDNGIGIDPQYKDRIFEIFQRLHTCEEYPGTGIGLAIAKKIVERHQGRIWVESLPGKGSTFNFTLPVDAKTA